ncbi:MAG: two-component system LytT family sensor kinase [Polaribacter sp.]
MQKTKHLLILLILILAINLHAQEKENARSKSYSNQQSATELLAQAKSLKDSNPTEAISLVEEAINSFRSNKKRKRSEEADAIILLGNIYEQIDQKELAIERYRQALTLMRKKDGAKRASACERLGQLSLALAKVEEAEGYFQECISWSNDKNLSLICQEGLVDVKLFRNENSAVTAILDSIATNYNEDSLVISRNEARRSQNYIQQNDYNNAAESFQNSMDVLPAKKKNKKESSMPLEQAKEKLLAYEGVSTSDKIEIRSNVASNTNLKYNTSNEALVLENLEIAELYESNENYLDAERFVVVAKDLIDVNTDAGVVADVYKKSSELNQRKGEVDLALNDLERYIKAKENAIFELELDLKQQVEIVKGQQKIDLQQKDYDLEEKDEAILETRLRTQQIIIGLLSLVLLGSAFFFYFLYKNVKEKRKANQLLLLKSLRTQMNPHFIFNALNSVNNFIAKNDEKAANKFLSDFSKLMRKVLDYSQKDFITFEEEIELNELYLKLEHFRFRDKFDYHFENKVSSQHYSQLVPPMLIQPFIENAIWHGLRYKEEKGELKVIVHEEDEKLIISISDNGIGRAKSKALKTKNQKKYKSTGMENVSRSMALINEIYGRNYSVNISDLNEEEGSGTLVEIQVPLDSDY